MNKRRRFLAKRRRAARKAGAAMYSAFAQQLRQRMVGLTFEERIAFVAPREVPFADWVAQR